MLGGVLRQQEPTVGKTEAMFDSHCAVMGCP